MSRIQAVDPAAADPKAQPLLAGVQKSLGLTPNLYRVAAHSPAALEGLLSLTGALGKGRFNARTRESIALAVGEANACDYCLSAHSALGKMAGLDADAIAAARAARSADPRTAALVGFARALVDRRGRVTDAELAELRAAGVSEAEIVETVAHTALNIFTNYLNHVADTEIDFPAVHAGAASAA